MMYIGEKLGLGGEEMEIAVDPLEGTTICARGDFGAMTVIALGLYFGLRATKII